MKQIKKILVLDMICIILFSVLFVPVHSRAQSNLIENSNFETDTNGIPLSWNLAGNSPWITKEKVELVTSEHVSGEKSVKVIKNAEDSNVHFAQLIKHAFIKGEEYQLRAQTKGTARLQFKFEFLTQQQYAGANIIDTQYTEKVSAATDWTSFSTTFTVPVNAAAAALTVILYETGTAYADDIELELIKEADKLKVRTDNTFYYSEWSGDGTAVAELHEGYPDYKTGRVHFQLENNGQVLLEETKALINGTATFTYPLTLLEKKAYAYTVRAVLLDAAGQEVEYQTAPIYKYDRPKMLDESGIFVVDGKPFIPIAMHGMEARDFETYLTYFKEAGINTVYCSAEYLDVCERLKLKAIVYLFNNMAPAGHPDNIDWARERLEAYSDHPALLAWKIMDEPRLNWPQPDEWLLRSYTLVKEYDNVHPVLLLEASPFKAYIEESARYCDVYATDPYPGSSGDPQGKAATFVYEMMEHTVGVLDARRGALATLQTCVWGAEDYFPTSDVFRSGVYQALWSGARGLEYYTYCVNQDLKAPWIHETKLWDGITEFNRLEKEGAFGHFIEKKYPPFMDYRGNEAWYRAYVKDGAVYVIVLNRDNTNKTVPVCMNSYNGEICLEGFTVTLVAGDETYSQTVDGNVFSAAIPANGVVLYKITPSKDVDFSMVSWADFEKQENLLPGGNMEAAENGMPAGFSLLTGTAEATTETAFSGSGSLKISGNAQTQWKSNSVKLPAGKYTVSFQLKGTRVGFLIDSSKITAIWDAYDSKVPPTDGWNNFPAVCSTDHIAPYRYAEGGDAWQEQTLHFTVAEGGFEGELQFVVYANDLEECGAAYIDNLTIMKDTAYIGLYNRYTFQSGSGTEYGYEVVRSLSKADETKAVMRGYVPAIAEGEKALLAVGFYQEINGVRTLLDVESVAGTAGNDGIVALAKPITIPSETESATLFMWDTKRGMTPYIKNETVKR